MIPEGTAAALVLGLPAPKNIGRSAYQSVLSHIEMALDSEQDDVPWKENTSDPLVREWAGKIASAELLEMITEIRGITEHLIRR